MPDELVIRTANLDDATGIAAIYNFYIRSTVVTFEETDVHSSQISQRIQQTLEDQLPFLVAQQDEVILGYAYASKWNGRCAYRYTVETTIYLAPDCTGKGIGTRLYKQLFVQLTELNFHMAIGGISLPNDASIALHEKMGMRKVAHFQEVGFKFNDWVDVGYWQGEL